MGMRKVKAEEAVGMVLGHDLTQVIPGEFKGPVFKRGHRIREEDIPTLLATGNDYIYVLELQEGELHEDEAAIRVARAVAGSGLETTSPQEGKVTIKAKGKGLLRVRRELVDRINFLGEVILSTVHDRIPCEEGMMVAATRVIPLLVPEDLVKKVEEICEGTSPVELLPYVKRRVGVVVTGNEVFYGRVPDGFDATVGKRIARYGGEVVKKLLAPDDPEEIAARIKEVKAAGAEVILTTGGLSVDPGDRTKEGVERAGAEVVSYGSPILPGAMFLYALLDGVPLLGLPACVFYHPSTVFDLIFPRVAAGEEITREDILQLGYGGLCLNCPSCRFPICPFGKV